MPASKGYATPDSQSPLAPFNFTRREPGPTEIAVDILYCGVCHSDLHMARNEWGNADLSPRSRPRDRRPRHGRRRRRHQVQGGRHRGHRRHRRFLPPVRPLPSRRGALLRSGRHAHLRRHRPRRRLHHHGRLLHQLCGGRALRPHGSRESRPGRRRPAALRRHHHLLAPAPLEGRPRHEGWHRRPGRPGPHGAQVRPLLRRTCRPVHHQPAEDAKTPSASAPTRSCFPPTTTP